MKKLDITTVEYQARVRKQAKDRTKRFREEQEKRGYKNLTVYLSKSFRAELERLSREKGLNRQDAMDHIFEIYHQNITNNVTNNAMINKDKGVETPAGIGSEANQQTKQGKIIKKSTQDKSIIEIQAEIPGPIPDRANTAEYKIWLLKQIKEKKESGMPHPDIAEIFNEHGIKSVRGAKWSRRNIGKWFDANKHEIEGK